MNTRLKILSGVVGLGFGLAASTPAAALVLITATVVQTNSNDCAGIFGGTGNTIPICDVGYALTPSAAVSPIIAKQNTPGAMEINGEFLTIDGTEFSISYDTGTTAAGSWTYLQGTGDPDVRYWVAKGGNDPFVLHWMVTDTDAAGACAGASDYNLACLNAAVAVTGGTWATGGNGLSHLSWYDTGSDGNGPPTGQAPEPGVLLLMGAGLLGLGMARRRKPA